MFGKYRRDRVYARAYNKGYDDSYQHTLMQAIYMAGERGPLDVEYLTDWLQRVKNKQC